MATIRKTGINQYLNAVRGKLADKSVTHMLQFGTLKHVAGQPMIRDFEGLVSTKEGILSAAQMHFCFNQGQDAVAQHLSNFSTGNGTTTGAEMLNDVKTIGAIDVTIITRGTSVIPFIAVDRAMKDEIDTIHYDSLVKKGTDEAIDGTFMLPDAETYISSPKTASKESEGKYQFGTRIMPRYTRVVVDQTTGGVTKTYEGADWTGDGTILFPAQVKVNSASIDYAKGEVSIGFDSDSDCVVKEVRGTTDAQAAEGTAADPADIIVAVPKRTAVQLVATRDNIIVQDNLANRMALQKISLVGSEGAGGMSPADIVFARVKNVYVEAMNRKVLKALVQGATAPALRYDLSNYALNSWNSTKNDQVTQLMTNLSAKFLAATSIEGTAIVTGTFGVALLACIPNMWTPNPEAAKGHNGLAGYFDGKPVYRHNALNKVGNTVSYWMVAKTPDNASGSVVFGEYLPLTSTGVVNNFNNPVNISNGFFSQTGVKLIEGKLVQRADIVTPSSTFGAGIGYDGVAGGKEWTALG